MNVIELSILIVSVSVAVFFSSMAWYYQEKARTYQRICGLLDMLEKGGFLSDILKSMKPKDTPMPTVTATVLPFWIVNGVCKKQEQVICNLGFACDGCPYNPHDKVDMG